MLLSGIVWWHDRPRVSVWWSSEWGEAGESAAPSRAPVPVPPPRSPPRDAQSSPVRPQRDIVVEIGVRENNIVKESAISVLVEQEDDQDEEQKLTAPLS